MPEGCDATVMCTACGQEAVEDEDGNWYCLTDGYEHEGELDKTESRVVRPEEVAR